MRENAGGQERGKATIYSGATGTVLHSWLGKEDFGHFGSCVAGIGDVDRDGYPDLAVAARLEDSPSGIPNVGSVTLFSGHKGILFNKWYGEKSNDIFGFSIAGGFFNTNSGGVMPDLVVGAPYSDGPAGFDTGAAYFIIDPSPH